MAFLSPFNVYMDDLSQQLNVCNTGCMVNHLMYTNDLVIFCPYSAGLQQLLEVCSQYGRISTSNNANKSNIMIAKSKEDRFFFFLISFYLVLLLKGVMRLNISAIILLMLYQMIETSPAIYLLLIYNEFCLRDGCSI